MGRVVAWGDIFGEGGEKGGYMSQLQSYVGHRNRRPRVSLQDVVLINKNSLCVAPDSYYAPCLH